MLFNSIGFAVFFAIVFAFYWMVFNKNIKQQNLFLLVASLFFYSCWDWRFLFLLFSSIALDFFLGNQIYIVNSQNKKKALLWLSIIINLGVLGLFKYYNFFVDNFTDLLSLFGFSGNNWTLKIILPIGISFYTFHGLSYIIDIYKSKIKPEKSIVDYALFVSFFPLLVAGPIERATHFLPQIKEKRVFNYENAVNGFRQILWGLVKKVVIADNCAEYVNLLFSDPSSFSGSSLVLGAVLFSFQIYGDFSGYSDIALGTARILGFDLLQNFSYPYFSRDIAEFWRRWHISLTSWFRDYIYIPLGGSRGSKFEKIRNVFLIFMLSGFWHGANWTFIFYGFINFLYFLPLLLLHKNRSNIKMVSKSDFKSSIKVLFDIVLTFALVSFARIFFRSDSVEAAFFYISKMLSKSLFTFPEIFPKMILGYIFIFICIEWNGRNSDFAIEQLGVGWKKPIRLTFYYILSFLILYNSGKEIQFLYFQF